MDVVTLVFSLTSFGDVWQRAPPGGVRITIVITKQNLHFKVNKKVLFHKPVIGLIIPNLYCDLDIKNDLF